MAGALERPVRDPVTPRMLEKVVWAGANLTSYGFSSAALCELAEVPLSAKQIRRMTSQVGGARVAERQKFVAEFKAKTLVERTTPKPGIRPPEVGVVMLDNGTHQRRDHFNNPEADTHWKQEAGGVVLSMTSQVHASDPCPDLPAWLVQADVVAEISGLAKREEHPGARPITHPPPGKPTNAEAFPGRPRWSLAKSLPPPTLRAREIIWNGWLGKRACRRHRVRRSSAMEPTAFGRSTKSTSAK